MVYVLLGTGFEEIEAITPIDMMRRAGIQVLTVGVNGPVVAGGQGIGVRADITLGEMDLTNMDMIVLPGGLGGVASIRASKEAMEVVRWAYENGKYTAAICAGPTVLSDLGICDGKNATCYPGCEDGMGKAIMAENAAAVIDGKVITGTSAGCAVPFGLALISVLKGQEEADRIAKQIVIR